MNFLEIKYHLKFKIFNVKFSKTNNELTEP